MQLCADRKSVQDALTLAPAKNRFIGLPLLLVPLPAAPGGEWDEDAHGGDDVTHRDHNHGVVRHANFVDVNDFIVHDLSRQH
jgi:hypothetical protein